jgi:probable HAF family extracellular repeat protein
MEFRIKKNLIIFTLIWALLTLAQESQADSYSYTTLSDPNLVPGVINANQTYADGINNSGQVAGWFGNPANYQGFVYDGSTYTSLNVSSSINSGWSTMAYATGINNNGLITGNYFNVAGGTSGFIDNGNTFTSINDPYAMYPQTYSMGINDHGVVAGYFYDNSSSQVISAGQNGPNSGYNGFIYDGATFTTIDDPHATTGSWATGINNNGEVVGYFGDANGGHGFVYNLQTIALYGLNGSIYGYMYAPTYTTLDDPNATAGTVATGINNNGDVTGYFINATGTHGFFYNGSSYTTIDDPNATAGTTKAIVINDSGQIVGQYTDASGNTQSFIATPTSVPVPAAFWLFGSVLTGFMSIKKYRYFGNK